MIYNKLSNKKGQKRKEKKEKKGKPQLNYHFVNGCWVRLTNYPGKEYIVTFLNKDTEQILYQTKIDGNSWTKCYYQYFINWKVVISVGSKIVSVIDQDLQNQRVFIAISSKSLGDNIAWMPYAEEFRKKHNCKVILSTFFNELFEENYPEIEFIKPGETAQNIVAQYNIGWYYLDNNDFDYHRNPIEFKNQPMQKTASDILGLDFKEIKPKITIPKVKKTKTVALGIHSTLQAKYWNNPKGWQDVVDYINSSGYKAVGLSKESDGFNGNKNPKNMTQLRPGSLDKVIKELAKSTAYVGIGTGLTWLAWACNVPVVLVSGFSEKYTEMQESKSVKRIGTPEGLRLTSGSFNKYRIDSDNWNWYEPRAFVGTHRQYECSKSIKSKTVIDALEEFL